MHFFSLSYCDDINFGFLLFSPLPKLDARTPSTEESAPVAAASVKAFPDGVVWQEDATGGAGGGAFDLLEPPSKLPRNPIEMQSLKNTLHIRKIYSAVEAIYVMLIFILFYNETIVFTTTILLYSHFIFEDMPIAISKSCWKY